jgi:hypothetical protein
MFETGVLLWKVKRAMHTWYMARDMSAFGAMARCAT